jgi:hypothetical protein
MAADLARDFWDLWTDEAVPSRAARRRARPALSAPARAAQRYRREGSPGSRPGLSHCANPDIQPASCGRLIRGAYTRRQSSPSNSATSCAADNRITPSLIAGHHRIPSLHRKRSRRGVDETGHQIAVFGRIGSRPFTLDEMKRFYMGADRRPFTVTDRIKLEDFVGSRQTVPRRTPSGPTSRN